MFLFILFTILFNSTLAAQKADAVSIAAIVNKHAITERDLELRIDFALASLNMQNTPETRKSMRHQVLQNLIVEKLQEVTAKEIMFKDKKMDISESDIHKTLEADTGMPLEKLKELFARMGVKVDTLKNRIRSQILWTRLIRGIYQSQIQISEVEIDKEMQRIQRDVNTDQYELVEIVLPIDEKNRAKSKQEAENLYAQLGQPMVDFRLVAQQFGAQSGYVGWKSSKQMNPDTAAIVTKLSLGNITKPIEDGNAYKIIKLLDKRLAGLGSYKSRKVVAATAQIPLPPEMSDENVQILEGMISHLKSTNNCSALNQAAKDMQIEVKVSDKKPIGALPQALQIILENASVGEPVGPIQDGNTLNIIMVCSMESPQKEELPTRDNVKKMLEQKKFADYASSLLKTLLGTVRVQIINPSSK